MQSKGQVVEVPKLKSLDPEAKSKAAFAQNIDEALRKGYSKRDTRLPEVFQVFRGKRPVVRSLQKQFKGLREIEAMVEKKDYEQAQKQLQPIMKTIKHASKDRNSSNPIEPVRKLISKLNEDLFDFGVTQTPLLLAQSPGSPFRLQDFITLEILKPSRSAGTVRKVLHVPSCKVYCAKQQLYNNKECRNTIRDWIGFWQTVLNSWQQADYFVTVHNSFWNNPQGGLTILMDYMPNGSLKSLLEFSVALSEAAVQQLSHQLLLRLQQFHRISEYAYGGLVPSQILLNKQGEVTLGIALTSKIQSQVNSFSLSHTKFPEKASPFQSFYKQSGNSLWPKLSKEGEKGHDLFSLGMILAYSILGSFDLASDAESLFQKVRSYAGTDRAQLCCCLIHMKQAANTQPGLTFRQLLQSKCSKQLISFLCSLLKLSPRKRPSIQQLIAHPFLQKADHRVRVSLGDLLSSSHGSSRQLPKQLQTLGVSKLNRVCDMISMALHNCEASKQQIRENLQTEAALLVSDIGCKKEDLLKAFSRVYGL